MYAHTHAHTYRGLSQARVRNCNPLPQGRLQAPYSLHKPQFPSRFMMSGDSHTQCPRKQCWDRETHRKTQSKHKKYLLWDNGAVFRRYLFVLTPCRPHKSCHQSAVLFWSCRKRDCLDEHTTAAYMGQRGGTEGEQVDARLLTCWLRVQWKSQMNLSWINLSVWTYRFDSGTE